MLFSGFLYFNNLLNYKLYARVFNTNKMMTGYGNLSLLILKKIAAYQNDFKIITSGYFDKKKNSNARKPEHLETTIASLRLE